MTAQKTITPEQLVAQAGFARAYGDHEEAKLAMAGTEEALAAAQFDLDRVGAKAPGDLPTRRADGEARFRQLMAAASDLKRAGE